MGIQRQRGLSAAEGALPIPQAAVQRNQTQVSRQVARIQLDGQPVFPQGFPGFGTDVVEKSEQAMQFRHCVVFRGHLPGFPDGVVDPAG